MLKTCDTRIRSFPDAAPFFGVADEGDGDLLGRFIRTRDESAFAEIVRRHGVMVLGVCQRVLDNRHDAEDCFQAAFMVLVKKAGKIQPRDMVGNWLYGVAYRTALEARRRTARRRQLEKKKQAMPKPESKAELWQELRPVLDQELSRLPDKFRFVLVACDLEGKTRSEVADLLDVPEGTVASRLARARTMLAKRLRRHNLMLSPGFLATLLAEQAPMHLSEELVARTARVAIGASQTTSIGRLADAVVAGMLWTKLKVATAVVCVVALLGLGVASMLPSADAGRQPEAPKADPIKKKPQRVSECVLRKVDLQKQEIQAARLDGDNAPAEIHDLVIAPRTRVIIGGQEAGLENLREGMIVNVDIQRGADGQHHATRIEAVAQAVSGTVEAVDERAITIRGDGVAAQENTYDLDAAAPVEIDGRQKTRQDLKRKMKITLRMSPDKARVLGIAAVGTKVKGVVGAVDSKRCSLNLVGVADGIPVADDAKITLAGEPRPLADVRPGMRVTLQMAADVERERIIGISGAH